MIIRLSAALLLLSTAYMSAFSLPRFASRMGVKCQSCHVNPTGKGMRTPFGQIYGLDDITIPTWKDASFLEDLSARITPNISIGLDMRTLFFTTPDDGRSSTFQMQGDLYFSIRLNKHLKVYIDKGLYSGFEIFALAKGLPLKGFIKAGAFTPAYGTLIDDHNAFIRGGPQGGAVFQGPYAALGTQGYLPGLRFGERSEDTGMEVGFTPSIFTITAGIFNGTPGSGLNGVISSRYKAVSFRADATVKTSIANVMLGGSYYHRPSAGMKETFAGIFGAVTFAKRVTLNSQVDWVTVRPGNRTLSGRIIWNELNVLLMTGIDLKVGYEFYDPDVDIKNGSFTRMVIGAEVFILPGVELRPLYRISTEEPTDIPNNEGLLLLHFFF